MAGKAICFSPRWLLHDANKPLFQQACLLTHACVNPPSVAGKKKAQDPFARKDWYDIKAPTSFNVRNMGKTLVTRTTGTKVGSSSTSGKNCSGCTSSSSSSNGA